MAAPWAHSSGSVLCLVTQAPLLRGSLLEEVVTGHSPWMSCRAKAAQVPPAQAAGAGLHPQSSPLRKSLFHVTPALGVLVERPRGGTETERGQSRGATGGRFGSCSVFEFWAAFANTVAPADEAGLHAVGVLADSHWSPDVIAASLLRVSPALVEITGVRVSGWCQLQDQRASLGVSCWGEPRSHHQSERNVSVPDPE